MLAVAVVRVLKQLSQTEVLVVRVAVAMGEVFQILLVLLELSILAVAVVVVVEIQVFLTDLLVGQVLLFFLFQLAVTQAQPQEVQVYQLAEQELS
jgi:hypothetical protein